MEVVYTEHFWDRFYRRKKESPLPLTLELVELAIFSPDFVLPDKNHPNRECRIKKVKGRCLKVVVEPCGKKLVVITLMFDRNLRRKGLCE
ncbi:MAG: DUF4258 domain-containing protein [Desulfurobacterium sp.]|nr:MAG: DUF4258 domain-containing protein [Desulfurobacterium sp.]